MGIGLQAGEELKAVAQGQCGMLRLLRQEFVVEAAAVANAVARRVKGQPGHQDQGVGIVRLRTVCLVLCTEEGNVVLYNNMQGFSAFLETAYTNWCRQRGLDPQAQDWHNPADHRWFPDQPDETH